MNEFDAKQERIIELIRMNADIEETKQLLGRLNGVLKSENLDLQSTIDKQVVANITLTKAMNTVVDKLLRQTIAQKSHRERNIEVRKLCVDILQILDIAREEYPNEDIPF